MNKYICNKNNLVRVNKTIARKKYNDGEPVLIVPCKCDPTNNYFSLSIIISKNDELIDTIDFDKRINYFTYFNCNYNELGKYPAYYIKMEEA